MSMKFHKPFNISNQLYLDMMEKKAQVIDIRFFENLIRPKSEKGAET